MLNTSQLKIEPWHLDTEDFNKGLDDALYVLFMTCCFLVVPWNHFVFIPLPSTALTSYFLFICFQRISFLPGNPLFLGLSFSFLFLFFFTCPQRWQTRCKSQYHQSSKLLWQLIYLFCKYFSEMKSRSSYFLASSWFPPEHAMNLISL